MAINSDMIWQAGRVEGDSWSGWDPDPDRAFRDHNPTLEPYASMSEGEILECMLEARGGREWEFLREFFIDKCFKCGKTPEYAIQSLKTFLGDPPEEYGFLPEFGLLATRLRGGG